MIGIITKIEDDSYQGKDFKKVTLGDGAVLKVKYGKEGYLKNKWGELQVGKAYAWDMGSFNGKAFVQDFKVTTEAVRPAAPDVGKQIPSKPDGMTPDMWAEKDRAQAHSIESQVCLKCACGLAKEDDSIESILEYATKMRQWIHSP